VTLLGRREEILAAARDTGTDLGAVELADPPGEREEEAACAPTSIAYGIAASLRTRRART